MAKVDFAKLPKFSELPVKKGAPPDSCWGVFGDEDDLGCLNFLTPEGVIEAAHMIKKGKIFRLDTRVNYANPPLFERKPAKHVLMSFESYGLLGFDDMLDNYNTQEGSQWDGLGHIFYGDNMWNGYDCRMVTSAGAQKCGIEKTSERMVGRGVLLDIPRMLGMEHLPDAFAITNEMLEKAERHFDVQVRRGDYLIVRTGQMEAMLSANTWDGYSGGDAPGLAFETLDWLQEKQVAAIATDTWGAEVRPNESDEANQPWHWISIPIMGLTVGEIFFLKELAKDCAEDRCYEFMFVAPALPVTGAVASPVNPLAIK